MIHLDDPRWLLVLLVVPAILVLGWHAARTGVRPRQHRAAAVLRALAVALLVLAIAGPRWDRPGRDVDVAFVVDGSDSVGAAGTAQATAWIRDALDAMGSEDRAAVARFGRDARLEHALEPDPVLDQLVTVVDGSATDLERALRLGQGVLGEEQRRRLVLLTDGRATQGDTLRAARELAAAGIAVDVVPLVAGRAADVLVAAVDAPARVRDGDSFEVTATLRNTGDAPAEVVVVTTADGDERDRRTVTVPPGDTEIAVPQVADRSGTVRYEVRLSSGASAIAENDVARAAVQVEGPARVLVYEGVNGGGEDLTRALDAAGIPADRLAASTAPLPTLDRLLDYDSVLLVDVDAATLGEDAMVALDAFVRDAGHGLVAIGGPSSYGMGQYDGTALEDLLPVFARVKDPKRRPSVAEALVVDVSGSMAACHCRPDGFAGGTGMTEEGGVNKTDISREAVARAVAALELQDTVGVLAFNAEAEWVLPLQQVPDQAIVDEALAALHPDGPTDVVNALREAIAGLKDQEARLRHIVLFTDGFSEQPGMVEVAREAAEAGITLSVVATGEGTGEVLRRMAEAGNGRFYPGRDLFSIPDIIVSEVQFAARPIITEGRFLPVVTGVEGPTEDLDATPPLLGYLATTEKPTARTLLRIGDERDPLLATWQVGLGTAVAWTSDAAPRWSTQWVSWERFTRFWSDVVKSTLPGDPDPRYSLQASTTSDGLRIRLDAVDTVPAEAAATATVTGPDGTRTEVELLRSGLSGFEATVPGGAEGVYAVAARLQRDGTDLFRDATTAIRSYSPEYAAASADPALLAQLAAAGGGRLDPSPAVAFAPDGLTPGATPVPLWPLLVLLALVLLPLDVGLRRLRLERGDAARALAWVRRRRGAEPAPTARRAATDGLFAARDRARATAGTAAAAPAGKSDRMPGMAAGMAGAEHPEPQDGPPDPAGGRHVRRHAGREADPDTAGQGDPSQRDDPSTASERDPGDAGGTAGLLAARRRARREGSDGR